MGGGATDEGFVGGEQFAGAEGLFVHGDAKVDGEGEQDLPGDAGEDPLVGGVGPELVLADEEEVGGGGFGDFAVAVEDGGIEAGVACGGLGEDVGQEHEGLDPAAGPADVFGEGGAGGGDGFEAVEGAGGVGHDEDGGLDALRDGVFAWSGAAGDLPIDFGVEHVVAADEVLADLRQLGEVGRLSEADAGEAAAQAREVVGHGEGPARVVADDFVDAVAEEGSAVFDGHGGVGFGDECAVEVDHWLWVSHDTVSPVGARAGRGCPGVAGVGIGRQARGTGGSSGHDTDWGFGPPPRDGRKRGRTWGVRWLGFLAWSGSADYTRRFSEPRRDACDLN